MDSDSSLAAQYQRIQEILDRNGNQCSPEDFRQIVNVVFHRFESVQYDEIHRAMWESLPDIFDYLASAGDPFLKSNLRLLDVGCGTGLSTTLLLNTPLGQRVDTGCFIDTSEEMLRLARGRSRRWRLQSRFRNCTIAEVRDEFDVILVSSVMHHIPDLHVFLKEVTERLSHGGIFIHLQDPNGDADRTTVDARKSQLVSYTEKKTLSLWSRLSMRLRPKDRYIRKTNQELLRRGIISQPLSDEELWSITDIHEDHRGISLKEMAHTVEPELTRVKSASYAFFGKLAYDLPEELRVREANLFASGDLDGTIMCGVWRKN